jgi:hypothetical protein
MFVFVGRFFLCFFPGVELSSTAQYIEDCIIITIIIIVVVVIVASIN